MATGSADQGDDDPDPNGNNNGNGQTAASLTTISADKTACGFWELTETYAWTVCKEVCENDGVVVDEDCDGYDIRIERGDSAVITYLLSAERSGPVEGEIIGVRGEITVTNTGANATEDLAIWDTIQMMPCDGTFADYVTVEVDTSAHPVLAGGESCTYSYEITFEPVDGASYRNVANVTISNFVDHDGEAYGVEACEDFTLPDEPTIVTIDETACLRDDCTYPEGFEVEALTEVGPWALDDEDCTDCWEFEVSLRITNVNAPGNMTYILCNQAILVPQDSGCEVCCHVPVTIFTGPIVTDLAVEQDTEASWTEDIELRIELPEDWTINNVDAGAAENIPELMPVEVSQMLVRDDGTYCVWGTIAVTNTGMYPTEGLNIWDTVQMWNGEEWVDVAEIEVDVSCMPVLQPGESYCYSFSLTFTLEHVSSLMLGAYDFRNVVYAEICNDDDDAALEGIGIEYAMPIDVPIKPCVLTMVTTSSYEFKEVQDLPKTGKDSKLIFETEVCYEQTVVVRYGDERVTIDSWTNMTAHTVVTHCCWHEEVSQELDTAIYHAESAIIVGDDNTATVAFESTAYDNETLTICVLDYPVEMSLTAVLYTNNYLHVHSEYTGYMFDNQQMMAYGVFASFEWPEEAIPPIEDGLAEA